MPPRRRDREAAPAPQLEDGVDHHALERVPGPAVASWMRYGATPIAKPVASRLTRARSIPRTSAIDAMPTPSTRSSRNSTARPSRSPAASAQRRARPVGRRPAPRLDPGREPAHREPDAADPRQRGEPERDDDEPRRDRGGDGQDPTPSARERVDPEHDRELLHQAEPALAEQRDAEHLEHARERPQAARSVEVQEVAVGDRALQHLLGEDEHEALFHRRSGRAQQPAQRQREHERDDRQRDGVAPALGAPASLRAYPCCRRRRSARGTSGKRRRSGSAAGTRESLGRAQGSDPIGVASYGRAR